MRWLLLLAAFIALPAAPQPAPLTIVNARLHQYDDGPTLPSSFAFAPGEPVFVSFQVAGFKTEGDDKLLKIEYLIEVFDAAGTVVVEPKAGKLQSELAPQDKEWKPKVRWEFALPPLAGSGSFRVRVWAKDLLNLQEAVQTVPFAVRGREVQPSGTLVVRNFRFLRTEEDGPPLDAAAYRPGDAVWARFDIVGYKLAEKNRIHVEYDLSVLSPDGKTLFTQPNAAQETSPSFYPKKYIPGIVSLNLQRTIKPGEYTIVLALRDEIGKQTAGSRHVFHIE
jgi:hypothetical protein